MMIICPYFSQFFAYIIHDFVVLSRKQPLHPDIQVHEQAVIDRGGGGGRKLFIRISPPHSYILCIISCV